MRRVNQEVVKVVGVCVWSVWVRECVLAVEMGIYLLGIAV